LRRAEAVALDVADYDRSKGVVTVRRGKGGKFREVPLPRGARAAIEAWLAVRGNEAGPVIVPATAKGKITIRRMSAQAVYAARGRLVRSSGIATFAPHDLRRSFVSSLLDAGADLSIVQKLAGHQQISTTSIYDCRGDAAKAAAAELLVVPFADDTARGEIPEDL
jgi:integrase/recombinase XerD